MAEIWQIVAAFGGGAVTVAILIKVLGTWFADRVAVAVDARIKHTYDQQIENLKADIEARQGILSAALTGAHAGHMAT
jgi:hypothetical protein